MLINVEIKEPTEISIRKTEELIRKYNREHMTVILKMNFEKKQSIFRYGELDIFQIHKN